MAGQTPWEHRVAQAIRAKRDVRVIRERTDVLVRYLLERPAETDPPLAAALTEAGMDDATARLRAREMLDRALFGGHQNPATVLGIRAGASSDDIRSQYRRLVQLYHPDRVDQPDAELGNQRVHELKAAYEALTTTAPASAAPLTGEPRPERDVRMDSTRQRRDWPDQPVANPRRKVWTVLGLGLCLALAYIGIVMFDATTDPAKRDDQASVAESDSGKTDDSTVAAKSLPPKAESDSSVVDNASSETTPPMAEGAPVPPGPLVEHPEIKSLIGSFTDAYGKGEVDELMQVFIADASENDTSGGDGIRALYEADISATRERSIMFDVHTVWDAGGGLTMVEGLVTRQRVSSEISAATTTVPFRLQILQRDKVLRIASLQYRE